MPRYTGRCQNCGDDRSPRGNVFTVMQTFMFEMDNRYQHAAPDSTYVKVCNSCQYPHAFHPRVSAKAKAREALLQSLLSGTGNDER